MGSTATTARSRARGYCCPVNASAPCFSRTREEPRRHRVLVRRGGAPRCHFSFSVFRRRLQLWGRPRRQPDRAHAGICPVSASAPCFRARARAAAAIASGRRGGAPRCLFVRGFGSPPASAMGSTATTARSRARGYFAPLTHPPPVSRARARSRGGIAFWSDVVARRAAIFLFRFFAAGFSYGVDRDDSPIARTRV